MIVCYYYGKRDGMNDVLENTKTTKFVENNAVVIVLFVILIVVTPYVASIIGSTWKKADESSTYSVIENVKLLYVTEAVSGAYLPFKVEYNRKGYDAYSNGEKYIPLNLAKVELKGQKPKSGSVTIKDDGTVLVKNLRFGLYKCNSDRNEIVNCGF